MNKLLASPEAQRAWSEKAKLDELAKTELETEKAKHAAVEQGWQAFAANVPNPKKSSLGSRESAALKECGGDAMVDLAGFLLPPR